jgi:hypothetical protein
VVVVVGVVVTAVGVKTEIETKEGRSERARSRGVRSPEGGELATPLV